MEHYYFSMTEDEGENVSVSFSVPHAVTIYEFHRMCKKFAAACGYAEKSIEEAFGENVYEE